MTKILGRSWFGERIEPGDVARFDAQELPIEVVFGDDDHKVREVVVVTLVRNDLEGTPLRAHAQHALLDLSARVDELWPIPSTAFSLRLDAWMDQVVARLADRVRHALVPSDEP